MDCQVCFTKLRAGWRDSSLGRVHAKCRADAELIAEHRRKNPPLAGETAPPQIQAYPPPPPQTWGTPGALPPGYGYGYAPAPQASYPAPGVDPAAIERACARSRRDTRIGWGIAASIGFIIVVLMLVGSASNGRRAAGPEATATVAITPKTPLPAVQPKATAAAATKPPPPPPPKASPAPALAAPAPKQSINRLRCCDGTLSPSCACDGSNRGCCSRHKGVCGCAD